jgi:ADP-ribosylglycohydrolase
VPSVLWYAYSRWAVTQGEPIPPDRFLKGEPDGWLIAEPRLFSRRAPGATCLSAMRAGDLGSIERRLNNSKGCGAVMRAAPIGLSPVNNVFLTGCEVGAITHGHPSGYLASGVLAEIIRQVWMGATLFDAIGAAYDLLQPMEDSGELVAVLDEVARMQGSGRPEPEDIERLGEGWVAEEALGIALVCALTADGFADGVRMAVNHSGDSDSTGAICGAILGTELGREAIPERWLADLELRDVVEQLAADLAHDIATDGVITDRDDFARYPPN